VSTEAFRVLVLEDDPNLRQVLEALLQDEGYFVLAADSGEAAIELARDRRFDLIVADIRMPGIDGLDTVQHLRSHDPSLQSLVMTGYASEEDPIRALHIGVQAYLRKPFSLDDFLARVRELAEKTRAARQQQAALERVGGSLKWALRHCLAEGVKAGTRTIVDLVQLVQQLARGLGLRSQENYPPWLECAALVACLRRFGLGGVRVGDEPNWPEPVEEILGSLDERWDGQGVPEGLTGEAIPVSSRLVALALSAWQAGYALGDARASQLESGDPGRFDPSMLRFLSSQPQARETVGAGTAHLLGVCAILLEKGAYRQVRELYREILSEDCLASQRVEALLGMTQVALGEGIVAEALQYARQLMEACDSVGPLTRANSLLRLGIVLSSRSLEAGVDCIRQAQRQFLAARHPLGVAESTLALSHFGNQLLELASQALAEFLRAQQIGRWLRTNPWIVPCLLDRCGEDALVRRLVRTVQREYPDYLKRLHASPALSDVGRRRLAELLEPQVDEPQEESSEAVAPPLQIFSLASFEVFHLGRRVDERNWPTQKVKYLAARLFLEPGRPISEDVLIDDFWAGELDKGRRNLSWSLTQLRRLLRELVGDTISIVRRGNSVVLSCAHNPWHDVVELGQILDALENQGQQLEPEVCGRLLSLYRGSYLPEHYADWAVSFRERLDSRISAFLTRALQEGGKLTPAVRAEIAHRLLEIDPCHQPACGELMNQAVQQGRPEEATRLFKRLETRLRSELGVEPDIKLVELFYRAELGLSHSV